MKKIFISAILVLMSTTAFAIDAAKKAQLKEDRSELKAACANEIKTAGCNSDDKHVASCLHNYKLAHKKDFKYSDDCKKAKDKYHTDKHS